MSTSILEEPKIGSFSISSGKVMVSDPCYEVGTWCQGTLDNVENGKWDAYVGRSSERMWGMRCAELTVVHSTYSNKYERDKWSKEDEISIKYYKNLIDIISKEEQTEETVKNLNRCKEAIQHYSPLSWEKTKLHVGVDSGQAGVFDISAYKGRPEDEEIGDYDNNPKSFYDWCCHTTGKFPNAGCIEGGAVSFSGYGDGGYDCYIAKKYDKIVGIKIVFIGSEEDEESEDNDIDDENDESQKV